jgi:putative DNA primase/helicase
MTPALPLFDPQLERLFVAALCQDPRRLRGELESFAVDDLTDLQAIATFRAIRNLEARGTEVSAASVRAELAATGFEAAVSDPSKGTPDCGWFDELIALPVLDDPPIYRWAAQILELKAGMTAALADAEPVPRRPPRGPRCDNTEPVRLAEAFLRYAYTTDGEPTLVRWARAWWRYDGTRYVEHDDEALERDVIRFLDIAVTPHRDAKTGRTHHERVTATTKHVNDTRKALLGVAPAVAASAPYWLSSTGTDPDPAHLAACQNGLLHLDTLALIPRTPRLFTTTAIGTRWEPEAPAPVAWLAFLRSLWGNDAETPLVLQQVFGYLLTPDTSQQKIFALIGPPRSGKGTIARILKALLGDDAVVNPTLASLEQPFGLAPLVGRSVAIIGDARLGGRQDQAQVVERLLSISGEDPLSINRKNRDEITVRLRTRVLLISNELPRLYDISGALASRFVILSLAHSFLGSEDTQLERKLLAELPGIFRWAIEGRQDLQERGRFVEPLASEPARRHLAEVSSPIASFLEDSCRLGAAYEVGRDALYDAYKDWCKASGIDKPRDKAWFGRDLHTLHPTVGEAQRSRPDGKRFRVYCGVGLA